MKKIITAIDSPEINEKLKRKKINIIGKDIQYKEGILEILEKEKNIEIIIINENLSGEIELKELINKIKKINKNVKIIILSKKENKKNDFEDLKGDINIIYFEKEINIKVIEEIIFELNIIDNIYLNNKEDSILNDLNEKYKVNNKNINYNNYGKIITFNGNPGVGKGMTIIRLAYFLSNVNNKILLIDFNMNYPNIYTILGKKKINFNKKIKYSKKIKLRKEKIKYKLDNINFEMIKNFVSKINNNIDLISYNKLLNFNYLINFKKYYDYILIKISPHNKKIINEKIISNSEENILIMEANVLGIERAKKIIEKEYKNIKLKIIINKKDINSIDENIIKNIFSNIKIIGKINYTNIYNYLINSNFKNNLVLNDKNIKKENKKIIKNF